jgi:hypothetical protein
LFQKAWMAIFLFMHLVNLGWQPCPNMPSIFVKMGILLTFVQTGLGLGSSQSLPPNSWDYRHEPQH